MKRNELNDIFVAKVLEFYRTLEITTFSDSIYEARLWLFSQPNYESNKVFSREDVDYIKKELAHAIKIDWQEFDELVFYNDNMMSVMNWTPLHATEV